MPPQWRSSAWQWPLRCANWYLRWKLEHLWTRSNCCMLCSSTVGFWNHCFDVGWGFLLAFSKSSACGTWRTFYIQNAFFQMWWLDVERFILLKFPSVFASHLGEHSPTCVALRDKWILICIGPLDVQRAAWCCAWLSWEVAVCFDF